MADVGRMTFVLLAIAGGLLLAAVGAGTYFARRVTARLGLLKSHAEEVIRGNLDLQAGPTLFKNCWEIMDCGQTDCPAFGEVRHRCWHLAGTMCQECDAGGFPEKLDSCRECKVLAAERGRRDPGLAEAFDVMPCPSRAASRTSRPRRAISSTSTNHPHHPGRDPGPGEPAGRGTWPTASPQGPSPPRWAGSVEAVVGLRDADLFPPRWPNCARPRTRGARHGRKVVMESSRETGHGSRWFHTVIVPVWTTRAASPACCAPPAT
jgi:hypothetical protein